MQIREKIGETTIKRNANKAMIGRGIHSPSVNK